MKTYKFEKRSSMGSLFTILLGIGLIILSGFIGFISLILIISILGIILGIPLLFVGAAFLVWGFTIIRYHKYKIVPIKCEACYKKWYMNRPVGEYKCAWCRHRQKVNCKVVK